MKEETSEQIQKEVKTEVYEFLSNLLPLSPAHLKHLSSRGISEKEAKDFGYFSLPLRRKDLLSSLEKKFGSSLKGVPGFWRDEFGNFKIAGTTGLAIPVRNRLGQIVSIKLRADQPKDPKHKYTLLSTNPKPDPKTGEVKFPDGAAAGIFVHHPLGFPEKIEEIRITEGEIKADLSTLLSGIYTVSLPGVHFWKIALAELKEIEGLKRIRIAFDSDKDSKLHSYVDPEGAPVDVAKALSHLYLSLRREMKGVEVKIETWPKDLGKGIDDVLTNGGDEELRLMEDEEAMKFVEEVLSTDRPEGWVYVMGVKRFINVDTLIEMDMEQFNAYHLHEEEQGVPATKALRNPTFPKAHYPIYLPAAPLSFERDGKKYLNLWRDFKVQPEEGDVTPFLRHLEYLLPDPLERETLLDWVAFCLQNPGEKIHWAILLQGEQGTGKSYIGWVMRKIMGDNNVSFPSNDSIHEVFTGWAKSCMLVVIEELMARGRLELMNKLKPMITQPTITIREMHKPPYEQPNVFNMLMFTNHEDAIIIDRTDRRYCVLFSPAKPREASYYEALWDWTLVSIPQILSFLLSRDLSSFLPKGHAPITEGKKELIRSSMHPLEAWLREGIEAGVWPFSGDIISPSHLQDCLPRNLSNTSAQALGKTLKHIGAIPLGQIPLEGVGRIRLWSIRRHETWKNETPETIAKEYLRWGSNSEPGTNPLLEAKPI